MRTILLFLITAVLLVNCRETSTERNEKMLSDIAPAERDSFSLLCQYWSLDDADNPIMQDITVKDPASGVELVSGILFFTDNTVLENPKGQNTYGTFTIDGKDILVQYEDGRNWTYTILRLSEDELHLERKGKKTSLLTYHSSHTAWPDAKTNPFSKQNYAWTKKPAREENTEQIRQRAKECIRFYQYYFEGFVEGRAKAINFEHLPNPFKWYQGGIYIQKEEELDPAFIHCFYSSDQAYEARKMLQDVLLSKLEWDTTQTNWVKQTSLVLKQMQEKM